MSASLIIKRNVLQTCSTCIGYRLITGTEKHSRHREEKKRGTGAISPALKFSQVHWPLGETTCFAYGLGESWPLCLTTAVCVSSLQGSRCAVTCEDGWYFNGQDCQPCHRFCATCAGTSSPALIYSSSSGLAFICLSLSISHAHPLGIFF